MMLINAFAVAITLLLSPAVVTAAPQAERNPKIKLCNHAGYDECIEPYADYLRCTNVELAYADQITSLDTYGKICFFYAEQACVLGSRFSYTGSIDDLTKGDFTDFNDAISSFMCGIVQESSS
ncbi:hypothetical protein LZ554_002711 [Drepanopeziza brunnea f. sp. 'monogermtubi']|nr:hypothetical protein LZ554_002711 [Drepanopeziza brunnea f. sp. 'monogermtubi']